MLAVRVIKRLNNALLGIFGEKFVFKAGKLFSRNTPTDSLAVAAIFTAFPHSEKGIYDDFFFHGPTVPSGPRLFFLEVL
jgi:hypothetical protein